MPALLTGLCIILHTRWSLLRAFGSIPSSICALNLMDLKVDVPFIDSPIKYLYHLMKTASLEFFQMKSKRYTEEK